MSREHILNGVYVSETGTRSEILSGVYLNETVATVATGWLGEFGKVTRAAVSVAVVASGIVSPPFVKDESKVQSRWYTQWQDPVRIPANVGAQKSRFDFVPLPVKDEVPVQSRWYKQWTDPYRVPAAIGAHKSPYEFAPPFIKDERAVQSRWYKQWQDPVRIPADIGAQKSPFDFIPPFIRDERAVQSRWYRQWADPYLLPKGLPASQQKYESLYPLPIVTINNISWFNNLSDPVSRIASVTRSEQIITDTDPLVSFGWFNNLSDPSRRVATATRYEQLVVDTDPVVSFGWFGELRDPSRRIARSPYETPLGPFFVGEVIYADKWFTGFSDPTRAKTSPRPDQVVGYPPIVSFGWFSNLSDPVKLPVGPKAALHPYSFDQPFPLIVSYSWFGELRDPVRRVPQATRYEQQSWSLFVEPTFISFGWFGGLSDPTRRILGAERQRDFFAEPFSLTQPERVSEDRWHQPWSDPVRVKPGLITAAQPPASYFAPFPITANFGWFGGLSDPVRRVGVATRYEQPSWSLFVEPVVTTAFGWFDNLSDPVRTKPDIGPAARVRYSFITVAARMSWYAALSSPVRIKPVATRYEQPSWSLFIEPTKYVPNAFTDPVRRISTVARSEQFQPVNQFVSFSWFKDLNDPVRIKPRSVWLDEQSFQFPFASFSWFKDLSEPVRVKPRVKWLDEQSFQHPFVATPGSWYSPWREPTPPKPRVVFFTPFSFSPAPVQLSFGWYGNLSLPVRIKPKVWEGQYQAWNPATINFSYIATMAATESRDFFLGVLYTFSPPIHALVDIIEIDPRYRGNLGVIENAPEPSILASIVTPQTIPATGVPVGAVRARVGIIVT